MKKIISLILILSMCLAFSSCAVNPENYSLALAAKAMEVKHSDTQQEGYEEFIDKLDAFAAKFSGISKPVDKIALSKVFFSCELRWKHR